MLPGRVAELHQLRHVIATADAGTAAAVFVEGEAGIGKSTLLAAMVADATERGFAVLSARPSPLERVNAFAAVRQLVEPALAAAGADGAERLLSGAAGNARLVLDPGAATDDPEAEARALHGLQWLVANLVDEAPVLLVLDDAHWADLPSLRFVAHLLRRAEGMRLAVAVGARPDADREVAELLDLIADDPLLAGVSPRPLDDEAAGDLIADVLGAAPEPAFVRTAVRVTGGNPFYLRELLRAAAELRLSPRDADAPRLEGLGPDGVARSVRRRVAACGPEAEALAQALAVLDGAAPLTIVAAVAGLTPDQVMTAADALVPAGVLEFPAELAFVHRVVRNAVQDDLPASLRMRLRGRAASALHAAGADAGRVAAHLLELPPRSGLTVFPIADVLLDAARAARGGGAPDLAERLLERALAEELDPAVRRAALVEVARVRILMARSEDTEDFERALALVEDPAEKAALALETVEGLASIAAMWLAAPIADRALAFPDVPAAVRTGLEVERLHCALHELTPEGGARALAGMERLLAREDDLGLNEQAALGAALVFTGRDTARGSALCVRALADDALVRAHPGVVSAATFALTRSDTLADADAVLSKIEANGQALGSRRTLILASALRGFQRFAQGEVRRAEDAIPAGIELAGAGGLPEGTWPILLNPAILALIERSNVAEAEALITRYSPPEPWPPVFAYALLRHARAIVALASGRPDAALRDLEIIGTLMTGTAFAPELLPWRSTAGLAHLANGDREAGRAVAQEEMRIAEAVGVARAVARAGIVAALCLPDAAAQARELAAILTSLQAGGQSLEGMRAAVHLGAALRRSGERVQARDVLRDALDLCETAGATALADLARAELVTAGARPRRDRTSGPDALTAAERRVADLAAAGQSNRDVAQALFLTTKTVEMHLSRSYRKLGIASRAELATVLA